MEVVGKIIQVLPEQGGVSKTSGKEWKLQAYVLETQEQYPRKVHFEVFGEDRIKANPCQLDDVVTVSFDIESREFNGRWYTSIRAWKIQQGVVSTEAPEAVPAPAPSISGATAVAAVNAVVEAFDAAADLGDNGDLPF